MNASRSMISKRAILLPGIVLCLYLAGAAEASAHGIDIRAGYTETHYVRARDVIYPRWLSRHRDFQHWYVHSRYRSGRHMSWTRLYDMYHIDIRERRHSRNAYCPYHRHNGYRPRR